MNRIPKLVVWFACIAMPLFVFSATAWAITHEADIRTLRLSNDVNGFLFTEGADNFGHDFEFFVGLELGYLNNTLVLEELDNSMQFVERDIVGHSWQMDLYGSVRLHDLVSVGFLLPTTLYQDGTPLSLTNDLASSGIGDLRLRVKFTPAPYLFKREKLAGFSFALVEELITPTGNGDGFMSDGGVANELTLVIDWRWEWIHLGFNFGWWARPESNLILDQKIDDMLLYRFAAGFGIGQITGVRALESLTLMTEFHGGTLASDPFHWQYNNPMEQTFAIRYNLWEVSGVDILFNTGVGVGYNAGIGTPAVRWFFGISYAWIIHDTDEDGVYDDVDGCINQPEDKDGFDDADGCPDPDNDNDGILDGVDKCPVEAEDKDGFEDEDGCIDPDNDKDGIEDTKDMCPMQAEDVDSFEDTDGCPDPDNDNDGLLDGDDKCPAKAEDKDGFEDADGCPDPDNDADGVEDVKDLCPFEAEDKDGFEDEDGCPELDNDQDGVPDSADACPMEPETINGVKDDDGCPDKGKVLVVLQTDKIEIKDKVYFETGSAVIKRKSFSLLRQIAQVLKGHNEIEEVVVEGYTDSRGNDKRNLELSQNRADAVKTFLINQGIEEKRLVAVGFGEDRPIASNKTRKGRNANRRVEFRIGKVSDKPRLVPLAPIPEPKTKAPAPTTKPAPSLNKKTQDAIDAVKNLPSLKAPKGKKNGTTKKK